LFFAMLPGVGRAQSAADVLRSYRNLRTLYGVSGAEDGSLGATHGHATLEWKIIDGVSGVDAHFSLPFTLHGGVLYLGGRRFLVSGSSEGVNAKGHLLLLELKLSPKKEIVEAATPVDLGAGVDPYDVVWNPKDKFLYLLDYKGKRILAASWLGGGAALPTQYATIATTTLVPLLSKADLLRLVADDEDGGVLIQESLGGTGGNPLEETPRLYRDQGQWKVEMLKAPLAQDAWRISSRLFLNARGPLSFAGGSGVAQLIEADTGNPVASLNLPGSGATYAPVALPGPDLLIPGLRYSLLWPDQSSGGSIRPLVRYGLPESSGSVVWGRGFANANRAFLSSTDFAVAGPVKVAPLPQGQFQQAIQVQLLVAARLADGSDPVQILGDTAILQAMNVLGPWPYSLDDKHPARDIGKQQIVGSDPNLAGSVILWQWVATWGSDQIAWSDVFGTTLFSGQSSGGGQALSARSAWDGKKRKDQPARLKTSTVAAARKWLGASSNGAVPANKTRLSRHLLTLMKKLALSRMKQK